MINHSMRRQTVGLLLTAVQAFYLWIGVSLAAWAQSVPLPTDGQALTLGEALRSSRPQGRLPQLESVGLRAASQGSAGEEAVSDRQPHVLADATTAFLSRVTGPGRHPNALVQTARFASRLLNAPNHALRRLTGADRARLDLRKRRVTFSWFVAW